MSIGLKRGTVALERHDAAWDETAAAAIHILRGILGGDALDIQHVGSTSIPAIVAKPIVDIAVCVREPGDMRRHDETLASAGIRFRKEEYGGQLLYVMGEGEVRTHHIHVLCPGDPAWRDYLLFRDYLNAHPQEAQRYSRLKCALAARHSEDRATYTLSKEPMIRELLGSARAWDAAGRG